MVMREDIHFFHGNIKFRLPCDASDILNTYLYYVSLRFTNTVRVREDE